MQAAAFFPQMPTFFFLYFSLQARRSLAYDKPAQEAQMEKCGLSTFPYKTFQDLQQGTGRIRKKQIGFCYMKVIYGKREKLDCYISFFSSLKDHLTPCYGGEEEKWLWYKDFRILLHT